MGIHLTSYGRYERGERSPDFEFIENVCKTFNINPTWLILAKGPMYLGDDTETASPAPASPLDRELLRQILAGVEKGLARRRQTLDPDKKVEIIDLLYDHYAKLREVPDLETVERYLKLVA